MIARSDRAFVVNGRVTTSVSGSKEADMQNPWKVATLGVLALGAIVGTSTLTTAYLLRPPASEAETTPPPPASSPEPRAAVVRVAPASRSTSSARVVARSASPTPAGDLAPAPLSAAVITPATVASPPAPAPAVVAPTVPSAVASADCDTGGERAVRIAKPGALGALLGAGLGAAGGAIAKGGKGAGQGALIGGIAGAAVGTGYGAYKTKTDCGTIFGDLSATGERAR
jgi:hypothetical protein